MSVTKISEFNKDSFALEDVVKNKYGSGKLKISTLTGGPLLFKLEHCFSFGIDNKFGHFTLSLSLKSHKEFVEVLELLEKECASHLGKSGEKIMKCLYQSGENPVLYLKITHETEVYEQDKLVENYKKYKDKYFHLNAIVKVESIFVSEKVTSIQVKLYEAKVLEEKPRESRKRML